MGRNGLEDHLKKPVVTAGSHSSPTQSYWELGSHAPSIVGIKNDAERLDTDKRVWDYQYLNSTNLGMIKSEVGGGAFTGKSFRVLRVRAGNVNVK